VAGQGQEEWFCLLSGSPSFANRIFSGGYIDIEQNAKSVHIQCLGQIEQRNSAQKAAEKGRFAKCWTPSLKAQEQFLNANNPECVAGATVSNAALRS
jgi:hypothetical protein